MLKSLHLPPANLPHCQASKLDLSLLCLLGAFLTPHRLQHLTLTQGHLSKERPCRDAITSQEQALLPSRQCVGRKTEEEEPQFLFKNHLLVCFCHKVIYHIYIYAYSWKIMFTGKKCLL